MEANTDNLVESTETLPPVNARDAAIKSLDSKCRDIVQLAHRIQEAERELHKAEGGDDKNALVKAAIAFGGLRERIYNLKDEIESDLRHYNLDCDFGISVSHTADGLPIRVATNRRTCLWG